MSNQQSRTIAVASGKGGTGKTTLAVGLALAASASHSVILADCDVEEPNSALFFDIVNKKEDIVFVEVPRLEPDRCTGCGACAEFCQYNALAMINNHPLIMPELCHSCGGCFLVCPAEALAVEKLRVGVVESSSGVDNPAIISGAIDVSRPIAPPVIDAVHQAVKNHEGITIIDCPPGASCSVIAAIEPADVVIAVVEPTPSGLHDFEILDDVLRELGKRCVTVINRDDAAGIQAVERCRGRNREPIAIIPFRKEFAADLLAGHYPQDLLKIMDEIFVKVTGHA